MKLLELLKIPGELELGLPSQL